MENKENQKTEESEDISANPETSSGNNTPDKDSGWSPLGDSASDELEPEPTVEQTSGEDAHEPIIEDIPEPQFIPPRYDDYEDDGGQEATGEGEEEEEKPFVNPAVTELPPQDKQLAAEQLADLLLKGYDKLHWLGRWYVEISEEDLMEKVLDGKIDLDMEMPIDEEGRTITVGEWVETYNRQSKEALTLNQEFCDDIRPPMIRMFVKHSWGVTDEQYVAYRFGEHASTQLSILVGFKRTANKTLRLLEKVYLKMTQESEEVEEKIDEEEEYDERGEGNEETEESYDDEESRPQKSEREYEEPEESGEEKPPLPE